MKIIEDKPAPLQDRSGLNGGNDRELTTTDKVVVLLIMLTMFTLMWLTQ